MKRNGQSSSFVYSPFDYIIMIGIKRIETMLLLNYSFYIWECYAQIMIITKFAGTRH